MSGSAIPSQQQGVPDRCPATQVTRPRRAMAPGAREERGYLVAALSGRLDSARAGCTRAASAPAAPRRQSARPGPHAGQRHRRGRPCRPGRNRTARPAAWRFPAPGCSKARSEHGGARRRAGLAAPQLPHGPGGGQQPGTRVTEEKHLPRAAVRASRLRFPPHGAPSRTRAGFGHRRIP
jgi:hypothetical protein